ncbi:MAG: hypothetical protein Q4F54_02120 [Coriobacteriia bacterium]|nr:hypothetical protein [Coriobacteriia bacterium]
MGNLFSVSNQTETFVRFLKESGPVPPPGPTPGPTPDPSNPEYWNAATGDGLFAIVSVLLVIAICAFGFFIWKKHKNGTLKIRKETFFGDSIALISSSHIAKLLIILVASCLLVFGCFGISHAAEKLSGGSFEVTNVDAIFDVNSDIFDNTGATEVDAGSNVLKAYGTDAIDVSQYVDVIVSEDETVALKYGSGYIKNDASETLMVHGLTVEGLEKSADAVK